MSQNLLNTFVHLRSMFLKMITKGFPDVKLKCQETIATESGENGDQKVQTMAFRMKTETCFTLDYKQECISKLRSEGKTHVEKKGLKNTISLNKEQKQKKGDKKRHWTETETIYQ